MSFSIQKFLETEITLIPPIMDHLIGKYYNNALYNGITWMIFILHILHFAFDVSVNALLKKMRFKEYIRNRLKKSVWYLAFYSCCFLYSAATLWKNHIQLPLKHRFQVLDLSEPISGHLILGYVLLASFYASSSMWEGLQCSVSSFTYLFLTGFVAFTYFLRYIELAILLTSTFSFVHIVTEFIRCFFCIFKAENTWSNTLLKFIFSINNVVFLIIYFLIIPISFALPMLKGLYKNPTSVIMAGLNVTLWGWLICEINSSPLYRLILHRLNHLGNEKVPDCVGSQVECALFLPRDDVAYNMQIIKEEIRAREARLMSMKKPKKRTSILMQTLKYVAAINRKIKYRKLMEQTSTNSNTPETSSLLDRKEEEEEELQSSIILNDFDDISNDDRIAENISKDEDEDLTEPQMELITPEVEENL